MARLTLAHQQLLQNFTDSIVWAHFFEEVVSDSRFQNILFARTMEGRFVGSLLLEAEEPSLWSPGLGDRCGSLSVLGVAADQQNKGTGLALAARAMEVIQGKRRNWIIHPVDWAGGLVWQARR